MFGSDVRERTTEIGQQLADLCSDLDPNTVPFTDTPAVFDQLVAIKKLAEGAVVRMTARYEEAGRWKASGAKDFEDDLARKTGSSRGKAKQAAKTSRRLKKCPKTDEAVRDGKLSLEQADAVASGAEASPEDEDDLLESADRDPVHELKKKAAKARAKADKDRGRDPAAATQASQLPAMDRRRRHVQPPPAPPPGSGGRGRREARRRHRPCLL